MSAERALLDALEYDPDVELPGPKLLESTCDALLQAPDIIRRRAALAVNDILRSELPLRFPAAVLAEGAVAVAYMVSRIPLPASQLHKDGGGAGSSSSSSLSSGLLRAQTAELDEIKATLQANAEFAMARKGQAAALAATSTSATTSTSAVACRAVPLTQSTPVPTASAPPRPSPVDVPVSQAEVLAVPPPQPPRPTTIRVGPTTSTTPPPGGGLS